MAIFSSGEMQRRFSGLRKGIEERQLDGLFLHAADNVFYVSGVPLLSAWGRPMLAVVGGDGTPCVVGAELEKENIEVNTWFAEHRVYADEEDVGLASLRLAVEFLREHAIGGGERGATVGRGVRRIGVERSLLPVGILEGLGAAFPEAELVEVGDLLAGLRIVKSPEELRLLELGGSVARVGASAFLEAVTENATELAVVSHAVLEMNRVLAALYPDGATSSYAYCHFGDHTLTPHHHATGRRLQRGQVVALNVFPVIWGYCTELERTLVFGEPSVEQERALEAVNEAFEAGKAQMAPGMAMADLDRLTRDILGRHGLARYIRHGAGHAHGIMIGAAGREEPGELRIYNPGRLAPGMVNSIEPGVYIPGVGGFRHSDVMLITDDGARCLTEFARDISYHG